MDSSFFVLFKFLHIATMFAAVASAVIPEVVLHLVVNTRDPRAIATFAQVAERIGRVLPIFFVGGAIFGLLAAWTGQLDFTAPWLIATYVLFVIAIVVGARFSDPWVARVQAAASASEDTPSASLAAVVAEPRAKVVSAWMMLTILVIIALMVFKPGA